MWLLSHPVLDPQLMSMDTLDRFVYSHFCVWNSFAFYFHWTNWIFFRLGCFHAVPCQWPIYYGGLSKQLSIHNWWTGIHHYGPNPYTGKTKIKSNYVNGNGIHFHFGFILHHMDFYANEIAWISSTMKRYQNDTLSFNLTINNVHFHNCRKKM